MKRPFLFLLGFLALVPCATFLIAMFFTGMAPQLYFQIDWRFAFSLGAIGWGLLGFFTMKTSLK